MSKALDDFQAEFDLLKAKHGISTCALLVRDPDDHQSARQVSGDYAWLAGQCQFLIDALSIRFNSEMEDRPA